MKPDVSKIKMIQIDESNVFNAPPYGTPGTGTRTIIDDDSGTEISDFFTTHKGKNYRRGIKITPDGTPFIEISRENHVRISVSSPSITVSIENQDLSQARHAMTPVIDTEHIPGIAALDLQQDMLEGANFPAELKYDKQGNLVEARFRVAYPVVPRLYAHTHVSPNDISSLVPFSPKTAEVVTAINDTLKDFTSQQSTQDQITRASEKAESALIRAFKTSPHIMNTSQFLTNLDVLQQLGIQHVITASILENPEIADTQIDRLTQATLSHTLNMLEGQKELSWSVFVMQPIAGIGFMGRVETWEYETRSGSRPVMHAGKWEQIIPGQTVPAGDHDFQVSVQPYVDTEIGTRTSHFTVSARDRETRKISLTISAFSHIPAQEVYQCAADENLDDAPDNIRIAEQLVGATIQ